MQADIYNKEGQKTDTIELNDAVFAVEPNESAMHTAVKFHLANKRQGTRKTKVRSEVRGGGKKPWKQKGSGRARAGSIRSPLWRGGGTIHGPKPHSFNKKLNKKVNRLARISALSSRIAEDNYRIIDDFEISEYKTKAIATSLAKLEVSGNSILLVVPEKNDFLLRSARNIEKLKVIPAEQVSAYDILSHKKIVFLKDSIEKIEKILN